MPDFAGISLLPLLYAVLLGGVVGLERELHGRPAGLRTHVLVCLSATMLIMVSKHVEVGTLGEAGRLVLDPNRMGAGIVTGIGFLGAATVLRSGDLLRGLTTAACIWFVAGLGIVLGNGDYALGVIATAIVVFVLTVMNMVTSPIRAVLYRRLIVTADRPDADALTGEVRAFLDQEGLRVQEISCSYDAEAAQTELTFYVSLKNELQTPRVTEKVASATGVKNVRWRQIG